MTTQSVRRAVAVLAGLVAGVAGIAPPASAAPSGAGAPPAPAIVSMETLPTRAPDGGVTPLFEKDGHCNRDIHGNGEMCFWWGYNFSGSMVDFYFADSDLRNDRYITPGTGLGQVVADNTLSLWNYDLNKTAWVWTDTGYVGHGAPIPPNRGGNHSSGFARNIESFFWSPPR